MHPASGQGFVPHPPGSRPPESRPSGARPPTSRPPAPRPPSPRPFAPRPQEWRPEERRHERDAGRGPAGAGPRETGSRDQWRTGHRPRPGGPGYASPRPAAAQLEGLVGPDEELVAGRHPVEEAFAARREAHRLLVVPQRRPALEQIVLHATRLRIPIVEVEGGSLTALAGFDGHQGVALVVGPRRFASLDDAIARARQRGEPPFLLVLDSLEDPQNLGTLLRSAEAAGVHGVIFPTRRQAPLTPAAVKASAGAVEHLLLIPVDDLAGALADLHVRGIRVAGAEADAPLTARQADLRGPIALVVGSEGQGLGQTVHRRCDLLVRIPMRGVVGSLNAAVAGSILLYEAVGQRDPEGRRTGHVAPPGPGLGAAAGPDTDPTTAKPTTAKADVVEPGAAGTVAGPEPESPGEPETDLLAGEPEG